MLFGIVKVALGTIVGVKALELMEEHQVVERVTTAVTNTVNTVLTKVGEFLEEQEQAKERATQTTESLRAQYEERLADIRQKAAQTNMGRGGYGDGLH